MPAVSRDILESACTPTGNPTYNLIGWQRPRYLLQEGSVDTFAELINETAWDAYGPDSGNPHCSDCMVHRGFEPSAVRQTFGSWKGFLMTVRLMVFGPRRHVSSEDNPAEIVSAGLELPVVTGDPPEHRAA